MLLCTRRVEVGTLAPVTADLTLFERLQAFQVINRNRLAQLYIPLKLVEINPPTLEFLTWFSAIQRQPMAWHYEKFSSLLGGRNPIP